METYTNELFKKVNENLNNIYQNKNDVLTKTSQIVSFLEDICTDLKSYISAYNFKDESEEIYFFKKVKPQLISKLLYYQQVYEIEILRPNGSIGSQYAYLQAELDKLNKFLEKNLDLYKYYRAGSSYLDKCYFVRGIKDILLNNDFFYFERDPMFSTSHDYQISKILAYELVSTYLKEQLSQLETTSMTNGKVAPTIRLTWTGKKVDLVELIYSWEGVSCFNNGNVSIKELAEYIEFVFNIDLGDYYNTFKDIRARKGSRTQFLDKLIKYLNERMDNQDN